ncbi:MAG: hypothetical protein KC731_15870, partial [Myxococcales bacterium]|nr:hypothetical protein [Myxococcales bacterium]
PSVGGVSTGLTTALSPTRLSTDGSHIYFFDALGGGIYRIPAVGGSPQPVVSTMGSIGSNILVAGGHVYWSESSCGVWRAPDSGGVAELVFDPGCGEPWYNYAHYLQYDSVNQQLVVIVKDGSGGQRQTIYYVDPSTLVPTYGLEIADGPVAVHDSELFNVFDPWFGTSWASRVALPTFVQSPLMDSPWPNEWAGVTNIVADSQQVFFGVTMGTNPTPSRVIAVDRCDGHWEHVVYGTPPQLALDDDYLYLVYSTEIRRVPR